MTAECLHLPPGASPPKVEGAPFRAVLVIEDNVSEDWRNVVSQWLVQSGCLYMMAWGADCSKWDDSVDWANLHMHDYGEVPDDSFVMTTWHASEPLHETFWFAKHVAYHPTVALPRVIIIHIAEAGRCDELLQSFEQCDVDDL